MAGHRNEIIHGLQFIGKIGSEYNSKMSFSFLALDTMLQL